MSDKSYERYKWIQQAVETDEEYQYLMEKLRRHEPAFHSALNALSQAHREAIIEHMGLCSELAQRETELLCFGP